jgi:hypothetical protein
MTNRSRSSTNRLEPHFTGRRGVARLIKAQTKTRGQSPRDGVADCLLFSVADGRIDRKIQRFERLCHVVDAPFARLATSSTGGGAALTSG